MGVISISILVSIMGLSFFTVMLHMVDSEVRALHRAEAHYAAESGAILGIRFIRQLSNWPEKTQDTIFIFSSDTINNFNVDVMYTIDTSGLVTIISEASSEEKNRGKIVIYNITRKDTAKNPINVDLQYYQESYTFNN